MLASTLLSPSCGVLQAGCGVLQAGCGGATGRLWDATGCGVLQAIRCYRLNGAVCTWSDPKGLCVKGLGPSFVTTGRWYNL